MKEKGETCSSPRKEKGETCSSFKTSRLQKPRWLTCDHGTAEETYGSIFCIHCGLETDQQPYRKEESRDDRVLRGLTLRKATLKELVLPSGRKPPENVHMISKYEEARVIGVRATQIANGARPKCSTEDITNSLDIATREFEQGLIPYVFKRRTGPRKPKEEYIPVSPSEVPLLVRKEKDKEVKEQILGHLGLLDEN